MLVRPLAFAFPLAVALALPASPTLATAPEKRVERALPLAAGGTVTLENYKGTVRIRTWDKAEVSVKARVTADGDCDHDAEFVEKTDVLVEAVHGGVSIRTDYDRLPRLRTGWFGGCSANPFVHYEVLLPAAATVRVKDYKSAIDIAGLAGDLSLETYKGTGEVTSLGGALRLETYKGELRVATAMKKETRVETYKGRVTLDVPKGAAFTLASDLDRRASLESDVAAVHAREGGHTSTAVNGGGPLLSLSSHKGELRLRSR